MVSGVRVNVGVRGWFYNNARDYNGQWRYDKGIDRVSYDPRVSK